MSVHVPSAGDKAEEMDKSQERSSSPRSSPASIFLSSLSDHGPAWGGREHVRSSSISSGFLSTSQQSPQPPRRGYSASDGDTASAVVSGLVIDAQRVRHEKTDMVDEHESFQLLALLATGQGSQIWTARAAGGMDPVVAVKVLRKPTPYNVSDRRGISPRSIEDIQREMELWIRASRGHKYILPLTHVLSTETHSFFLSPLATDGTLYDLIRRSRARGKLPFVLCANQVCTWCLQISGALDWLHNVCGIVHGDVKLENILLQRVGKEPFQFDVQLADFGLAQSMTDHDGQLITDLYRTADPVGTLAYAAPEQLRNDVCLRTPQSDVWAFGCSVYGMVVGQQPFAHAMAQSIRQKISAVAYDSALLSDIDTSGIFVNIVRGCLVVDVSQRYSLLQVERLLHEFLKVCGL